MTPRGDPGGSRSAGARDRPYRAGAEGGRKPLGQKRHTNHKRGPERKIKVSSPKKRRERERKGNETLVTITPTRRDIQANPRLALEE